MSSLATTLIVIMSPVLAKELEFTLSDIIEKSVKVGIVVSIATHVLFVVTSTVSRLLESSA